ncbi:hypothetical protein [Actinokineospora sp. NBRC 105648]|uniref:Cap15 family cyclic dinucleotide receptor domain-containing protein n=1 Tax=Actinokineospora sp. NBRC 105648 TaxID=3032206 RepID=UPI0033178065
MRHGILVRVSVAVVILVFAIGTWVKGGKFDPGWLKFFSAAVLLATIVFALWDLWLWKIRPSQLFPGVPRRIGGTWKGTLTSFWEDPATGRRAAPKTVYLVVRQTASLVSVKLLTNESRSASSLAAVSTVDGTSELAYLYLNRPDPRFEEGSRMHHGSTVLSLSGEPVSRMRGRYWTDRDTRGELNFHQWTAEFIDDFDEAQSVFDKRV